MNNAIKINKFLIIGIVLLFGLIIGKLIYVSASTTIDGIDLNKFALSRTTGSKVLYASRGSIYDCSGEILAEIKDDEGYVMFGTDVPAKMSSAGGNYKKYNVQVLAKFNDDNSEKKIVVKFFILLYINNHGNVVKWAMRRWAE